jgi:hypothetical protein
VDDVEEDKVELALAGGQDEVEVSERSEAQLRRYAGCCTQVVIAGC